MAKACIICGGVDNADVMDGLLKKCRGCGLVFSGLEPSQAQIEGIYGEDYFNGRIYADYVREAPAHAKNFDKRIKELFKHIKSPSETDVFEIGSAYGFFLQAAKNKFRSVTGIDITKEGCRYARDVMGLDVTCGDFLTTEIEKDKYGLFCMWDTIEHLKEPQLYLKKIGDRIKKDGILSVTTGDIGSAVAAISGKRWRLIHPPEHLYYFSRKTISELLKRHGFKVEEIVYGGNYRSARTLLSALPFLGRIARRTRLFALPVYMNLYDIMHVIARKNGAAA